MIVDGPGVFISARTCAVLLRDLRERDVDFGAMRVAARGVDPAYATALVELHSVALAYEDRIGGTAGTKQRNCAEPDPRWSLPWVTTSDAADLAHCTSRAVRKAAAEGRLPAERADGAWRFDPAEIRRWATARRT